MADEKKRRPRRKKPAADSTAQSPVTPGAAVPALVPQPHGGALRSGGTPGNAGGSGRVPSELRSRLRGSMADRIKVIEDIADGEVMQKAEIPLLQIMRHVRCPKCGEAMKTISKDIVEVMSITVVAQISATPRDRISAIDVAAKYGLGTKDEISLVSPDVVARLTAQAERFVSELPPDALAIVKRITDEVWQ